MGDGYCTLYGLEVYVYDSTDTGAGGELQRGDQGGKDILYGLTRQNKNSR
jgi:hypothetical protein